MAVGGALCWGVWGMSGGTLNWCMLTQLTPDFKDALGHETSLQMLWILEVIR
jgi:hypothetical protein